LIYFLGSWMMFDILEENLIINEEKSNSLAELFC